MRGTVDLLVEGLVLARVGARIGGRARIASRSAARMPISVSIGVARGQRRRGALQAFPHGVELADRPQVIERDREPAAGSVFQQPLRLQPAHRLPDRRAADPQPGGDSPVSMTRWPGSIAPSRIASCSMS